MNDFFLFVNCPKFVKSNIKSPDMIGEQIRELRESHDILLRELATKLDIDQAVLSKMERGERSFRREDIEALAKIFKQSKKKLLTIPKKLLPEFG